MLDIMSSVQTDTRERILRETWRLMEERRGEGVRMSDIAKAAGISRQALYLHFRSRTELMIATTHYLDQVRGLEERLRQGQQAITGVEAFETYLEIWGNYIPEVYGLSKALLSARETDPDAAAAWDDRTRMLRENSRKVINCLLRDGVLAPEWSPQAASDLLWSLMSVQTWENLTIACGWSHDEYVQRMKALLKQVLVRSPREDK